MMCDLLCQNPPPKRSFIVNGMDNSINEQTKYIPVATPLLNVDGSAFTEACWTATSARVSIKCYWLASTGNHAHTHTHTTVH